MFSAYPARYPQVHAINSLALRFNLPNDPNMQDWEYEVADTQRINEFLTVYLDQTTSEDENFILMEILIQSFEESNRDLKLDSEWNKVLSYLENNLHIHAMTICYWARENKPLTFCWKVTPYLRGIRKKYKLKIIYPNPTL